MTPCTFDRKGLLQEVLEQFKVNKRGVHGPSHWARVRHHALTVGEVAGADLLVVELFAFLHDSKRLNEDKDPEHGSRAASFATQLNGRYFKLDGLQLDVLCHAMTNHSNGAVDTEPTVQTCWDADRLDLGRVGIKPAARYLSLSSLLLTLNQLTCGAVSGEYLQTLRLCSDLLPAQNRYLASAMWKVWDSRTFPDSKDC